LYNPHLMN